jgi:hypothetical protein
MKRAAAVCAILLLAAPAAPAAQFRPQSRIVEQPDAPVHVTASSTEYQRRTNDSPEGVRHQLEYSNRSTQKIVAIQFGLISFDIWNEFLARTAGLATEDVGPRARKRGVWLTPTDAAIGFLTAVVYVDRVRFESGEIWIADKEQVLTAMRAIQKDFDPANLNPAPKR